MAWSVSWDSLTVQPDLVGAVQDGVADGGDAVEQG